MESPRFFSPDSRWIGFVNGETGAIAKVSLLGSETSTVVQSHAQMATWTDDDDIVFTDGRSLFLVSADGGEEGELLAAPEPGTEVTRYVNPQSLPGVRAVVFEIEVGSGTSTLATLDLDTREIRALPIQGSAPKYAPTGHLVFARAGSLFAVAFDLESLSTTGDPANVLPDIGVGLLDDMHYSFSTDGSLIFVPPAISSASTVTLLRVDREGNETTLTERDFRLADVRLSPDGRRVAVRRDTAERSDVMVYEFSSDTWRQLTTRGRANSSPVWSHDGEWILFRSTQAGGVGIYKKRADFSDDSEELVVSMAGYPNSVSPDGKLVFSTGEDLWWIPLEEGATPQPLLQTDADEDAGEVSPDGTLVAYVSEESDRAEVYVRPFLRPGGSVQVSNEGGIQPTWSPSGNEIFYRIGAAWVVAEIETEPRLRVESRTVLFEKPRYIGGSYMSDYAVTEDGDFLVVAGPSDVPLFGGYRLIVVLNWFEELMQRVPAGRQ